MNTARIFSAAWEALSAFLLNHRRYVATKHARLDDPDFRHTGPRR